MSETSISDHIGRIGENWFDLIANQAKLLVAKIEPDRLGRDRVIEFPAKARAETEPFDKRAPPLGCSIQIKTILSKNSRVKLTLSVADRLVKDNRPTLVCILRVRDDEVVDMYLVHLLGKNLSAILKRLRAEFAKGAGSLNHSEISFSIKSGRNVELTPKAFRLALEEIIGSDMDAYCVEKARQRESAGFKDDARYSMNITFDEMPSSELIDGMLGLKGLGVSKLQSFEERFKIKLPNELPIPSGFSDIRLEVSPTSAGAGVISLTSPTLSETFELRCQLIAPALPGLSVKELKFIARTSALDVIISVRDGAIQLKNRFDPDDKHKVEEWFGLFQFWNLVFTSGTRISLCTADGLPLITSAQTDSHLECERPEYLSRILSLLEMTDWLLHEAEALDRSFSLNDIMLAERGIQQTHSFFLHSGELGSFSFTIGKTEQLQSGEHEGLFISTVSIGNDTYAYALKLSLVAEDVEAGTKLSSKAMIPLSVERIESDRASLERFANYVAKFSGSRITILTGSDK